MIQLCDGAPILTLCSKRSLPMCVTEAAISALGPADFAEMLPNSQATAAATQKMLRKKHANERVGFTSTGIHP